MTSLLQISHLQLPDGAQLAYTVLAPSFTPTATILCFNGAFCNLYQYIFFAQELVKAGVQCILHDCRGVGQSIPANRSNLQFTFDQYIEDAEVLLNHLNISQVITIGMAWGSRPAFLFGTKSKLSTGVALFDFSMGVSVSSEHRSAQIAGTKLSYHSRIRKGIVEPSFLKPVVIEPRKHRHVKNCARAMAATSKAPFDTAESFAVAVGLDECTVKVLLATGEYDINLIAKGGTKEVFERLQEGRSETELCVLDNCGHGSIMARPILCSQVVLEWMTRMGLCNVVSKQ